MIRTALFRVSPILRKINDAVHSGCCGELSSLRLIWQRPRCRAASEEVFRQEILCGALDAVEFLARSPLSILQIQRAPGSGGNLFALAGCENGVAASLELNETLPDTMPDSLFWRANFTNGHLTNQPLVGHFNTDGAILATEQKLETLIFYDHCTSAHSVIEELYIRYDDAPVSNCENTSRLLDWIQKALS